MKKIKIAISLYILMVMLTACQSTSSNTTSPTQLSSSNFKLYPYKSAILKYKQKDQVLIWDDWGLKTYESRDKNRDIIMVNNGQEYRIKHHQKKITKMRSLIMDWLIVADKDLRPYYVASKAENALIKTGESEKVAGYSCNIWIDSVPLPSTRYCLYNDLIILKKETHDSQNKKWRVEKEAYLAKFDIPIDSKLFTNIPDYPTRNLSKYTSNEIHKLLKEDPQHYKASLETANKIKERGERHRERVKAYRIRHKKMIELYLNHRIGNATYYP